MLSDLWYFSGLRMLQREVGVRKKIRSDAARKKVYVEVKQASATRRIYVHFLIGFYGWPELRWESKGPRRPAATAAGLLFV